MIDAALELVEEGGAEALSVRAAAQRAGVSPGAPFRHFASRTALLTALAEEVTQRLRQRIEAAVQASAGDPPLARFAQLGQAYLHWAVEHPAQFRMVSDRQLIDFAGSDRLQADNDAIREHMGALLAEAAGPHADVRLVKLTARALAYGLARMACDGHLDEWAEGGQQGDAAMQRALMLFIGLLEPQGR
ncbi:MAG: TetR/AcrR family transcriptional regulator [Pseudomonadota bacterium]|nr:TetR/AcrR family transcriptional regulator [Pseudomonadota bacterium]